MMYGYSKNIPVPRGLVRRKSRTFRTSSLSRLWDRTSWNR